MSTENVVFEGFTGNLNSECYILETVRKNYLVIMLTVMCFNHCYAIMTAECQLYKYIYFGQLK